jgi:lipid-binding SYLF domain-containing protein
MQEQLTRAYENGENGRTMLSLTKQEYASNGGATMKRTLIFLSVFLFAFVLSLGWSFFPSAVIAASDKVEAQQLVDKAGLTFQSFMDDAQMGTMRNLLKNAKGLFIAPQVLKGAFIIGASGGSGVYIERGKKDNWYGPAFYTLGGASIGLQIGGQASEVVLLIMTDRGNAAFLSNNFKLGVDAGIAVGPVGAGVSAETANLSADVLSFSRSKGLYGGVSLQGAVVATRGSLNRAYYGKKATTADILVRHNVSNPQASGLLESVTKGAKK